MKGVREERLYVHFIQPDKKQGTEEEGSCLRCLCTLWESESESSECIQSSAKQWALGCVIPPPGHLCLRGEFLQPRVHFFTELCSTQKVLLLNLNPH